MMTKKKGETYEVRHRDTGVVLERTNVLRFAQEVADKVGADVYAGTKDRCVYVGRMDSDAPAPNGTRTESDIAEEWGCHPRTVEYRMRKLGMDPLKGMYSGSKREKAWYAEDVERAAVLWAERVCGGNPDAGEKLAELVRPAVEVEGSPTEIQGQEEGVSEVLERLWRKTVDDFAGSQITARRQDSPELLELIADRIDRMQVEQARIGAILASRDSGDPDELARLRRPVSAAALLRIVSALGDVDVDSSGPWLVLRVPGKADGVAA